MKQRFLLAIAAIVFTVGAFAQPTQPQVPLPDFMEKRQASDELSNEEVANYLKMSKEGLLNSGVADLDKVYPGQVLMFTFTFKNGATGTITHFVEKGDNVWNIIKYRLAALIKQKNAQPVPYVDPEENKAEEANKLPGKADEANMVPGFGWLFGIEPAIWKLMLAIIVLTALFLVHKNRGKIKTYFAERKQRISRQTSERQQQMLATNNPIVRGGVSDADAVRYMDRVAQRANVTRYGPVTKGRLTTFYRLRVMFANGGRKMRLTDVPVFMSRARRNSDGSECEIAFIQPCGNDGCEIDMSRANFVPDQVQTPALQAANQAVATEAEVVEEKAKPVIPNELSTIISAMTEPMKGKDNGKLKVTIQGITVEMEFSSSPKTQNLLINGTAKEQVAIAEVTAQ
jgi:hypothetical protein